MKVVTTFIAVWYAVWYEPFFYEFLERKILDSGLLIMKKESCLGLNFNNYMEYVHYYALIPYPAQQLCKPKPTTNTCEVCDWA
jgi:hypothetical protein